MQAAPTGDRQMHRDIRSSRLNRSASVRLPRGVDEVRGPDDWSEDSEAGVAVRDASGR
jgi:hypothetical protein